jgi:hypothetical protein
VFDPYSGVTCDVDIDEPHFNSMEVVSRALGQRM